LENNIKRLVSLGLCFTLSIVLVFASVLSHFDMNMVVVIDTSDAPMTKDTTTAGSDGDDEDQGDDDQEDAPVTQDTINVEGDSRDDDDDDDDEDNSGQNNNDNNDNEPATNEVTEKPDCPAGQENGLFESRLPIQACGNNIAGVVPVLPPNANNCVNAPIVDHPSAEQ
jgi:hypothetical protein